MSCKTDRSWKTAFASVRAPLFVVALLGCGGSSAPETDASVVPRTDSGMSTGTDSGMSIGTDSGMSTGTDSGMSTGTDAGGAIVDAGVGSDAAGSTSAWVCRRTASITCDCQDGGDPTTFPIANCSHMPDGRRFCASAIHIISGRRIPICQCYNAAPLLETLVTTWSASPDRYTEIRGTATCPPR